MDTAEARKRAGCGENFFHYTLCPDGGRRRHYCLRTVHGSFDMNPSIFLSAFHAIFVVVHLAERNCTTEEYLG